MTQAEGSTDKYFVIRQLKQKQCDRGKLHRLGQYIFQNFQSCSKLHRSETKYIFIQRTEVYHSVINSSRSILL